MRILVDADACPVKEQIYRAGGALRVAGRGRGQLAAGVPDQADVAFVHVPGGLDAVDDWIADEATGADIVTTADILLAGRVVDKGAVCIDFRGKEYTPDSLGGLLATREVAHTCEAMARTGAGRHRSTLGIAAGSPELDEVVNRQLRAARRAGLT